VEASPHDAATAFVVFENHQQADWTPYVFVTRDYGKTWDSLATPDIDGFAWVIKQDPRDPELLFLGTEFHLYVSFDGGQSWLKWTQGLPTVAVRDLAFQRREDALVVGTHGRSAYVIDDISPLRQVSETVLKQPLYLFPAGEAKEYRWGSLSVYYSPGDTQFKGANRAYGAPITYVLNPAPTGDKKADQQKADAAKEAGKEEKPVIEILDDKGQVIRTFKGPAEKGINRAAWDLCRKAFPPLYRWEGTEEEEGEEEGGLSVMPGTYTARVKYAGLEEKATVLVNPDPRLPCDEAGLRQSYAMAVETGGWLEDLDKVLKAVDNHRQAIKTLQGLIPEGKGKEEPAPEALTKLKEAATALAKKLKGLKDRIVPDEELQGFNDFSELLGEKVNGVYGLVADSLEAPTQAAQVGYEKTKAEMKAFLAEFNQFYEKELLPFQKQVAESGFSLFKPYAPLTLED
jgi:hypothetical protein